MITRILRKLIYIITGVSNEQLTLRANINNGLKAGNNIYGLEEVTIDHGHSMLIEIEDDVIFAPGVYLLAHDTSTKKITGYTKIGKIKSGKGCFIGARTLIMPNVEIGENSIIGANSLVKNSVPANVVAAGNPAKIICTLQEYEDKIRKEFEISPSFDYSYTVPGGLTDEKRQEMVEKIQTWGFIK